MSIVHTKPTIVNKITTANLGLFENEFSFWMVTKDGKWSIHYNRSWGLLAVTDTSSFFKNKTTMRYTSHGNEFHESNNHRDSIKKLKVALEDGKELTHEILKECMDSCEEIKNKSLEAFNPFSVSHIKPFKNGSKFRRNDVVKIIVNEQYERIQIDSRYTDDYAWDAHNNFFRDVELKGLDFLKTYLDLYDPSVSYDEEDKIVRIYYGSTTYSIKLK